MRVRLSFVWLAGLTLTLLGGGVAAACTTPNWVTVDPAELGPGTQVTVDGGGYEAGEVELRWDGMRGASLGSAQVGADGLFTTTVTIPADAAAGRASVVAVQPAADGTRLWGYTDVVLPEAAPTSPFGPAAIAGGALLSLAGVAAASWVRRRTVRDAALEAALQAMLDERDAEQDREPTPSS